MSNVVTEENFSLLWQEMLHPHLEEERQKALADVAKVKAEGKQRLAAANQKIESMLLQRQKDDANTTARLEEAHRQDRDAIEALCRDVEKILRRKRLIRIGIGSLLALLFAAPLLMETTPAVQAVSFAVGVLLGYLTATGGRLLGTDITEAVAQNFLNEVAGRRKLAGKLEQFVVSWRESGFRIEIKPEPSVRNPGDLFNFADGGKEP